MVAKFGPRIRPVSSFSRQKKYNENALQRDIVKYLNENYPCRLTRIKNQGTWDPGARAFRANTTEKGIPDIIGCSNEGRAIYIEVKCHRGASMPRPSKEQKEYLVDMRNRGAIVGVAYDVQDAIAIVLDDPEKHPRNVRTFGPRRILAEGTKHEQKEKKPKARISQLDLIRAATASLGDAEDGDEC